MNLHPMLDLFPIEEMYSIISLCIDFHNTLKWQNQVTAVLWKIRRPIVIQFNTKLFNLFDFRWYFKCLENTF